MDDRNDRYNYHFPEADHAASEEKKVKKHPGFLLLGAVVLFYSISFLIATCAFGNWYPVVFSIPFILAGVFLIRKGLGKKESRPHIKKHTDDCCQHHDYSGMDPIQREYYEQYDSYHHNRYYGDADITQKRKNRCPHCGKRVRDEYEYCPRCGSRLL